MEKLESLSVWLRCNQPIVNLSKTCYTLFGKQVEREVVPLLMQGKLTERIN